jgi:integral membrane protein
MSSIVPFLKTKTGRLRIVGFLEGISLLVLVFIAVPLKHLLGEPWLTKIFGSAHGVLFLFFVFCTFSAATEQKWKFMTITWKILLASVIPFGTFYVDAKILSKVPAE